MQGKGCSRRERALIGRNIEKERLFTNFVKKISFTKQQSPRSWWKHCKFPGSTDVPQSSPSMHNFLQWKPEEWNKVIFTDKKKWNLMGNDAYMSAWV
jgi:hypothetical protein